MKRHVYRIFRDILQHLWNVWRTHDPVTRTPKWRNGIQRPGIRITIVIWNRNSSKRIILIIYRVRCNSRYTIIFKIPHVYFPHVFQFSTIHPAQTCIYTGDHLQTGNFGLFTDSFPPCREMFHEITVQILVFGNRHLYVTKIIPRLQPFPYLNITSPLPDHLPVLVNFLVKFRPLTVQQPFFPFQDTGSQIIFI